MRLERDDWIIKTVADRDRRHLMHAYAYQGERHPVAAYLSRLSVHSRPTMQASLAAAAYILTGATLSADQLPWHRLRSEDMYNLRDRLADHYAPATVNRILAGVRGVLRACQKLRYMSVDQQMRASSIPPVPDRQRSRDYYVEVYHVGTLLEQCNIDSRPAGRRDAALLTLLYGVGLRSSEIVALDLDDYSPTAQAFTPRQGVINRQLSVSSGIARVLHRWLLIRGQEPGPFLVPISKSGRPQPRRLTSRAIIWILRQRAIAADMPSFSPGDFRRSYLSSRDPIYMTWRV